MKNKLFLLLLFFLCLTAFSFSQESNGIRVEKIGSYKCGRQPKQVIFSPDGKFIIMPLLDDTGFDIFSLEEKKVIKRVNPPNSKKVGFAEGLFIPEKNIFLVSQMTCANLYEYSYPDFVYKRTIATEGVWSKFIAWSAEQNILAVSNWVSNDISIIDFDSGKVIKKIKTGKAPRGLVFTDNGKNLISLSFDSGIIEKFNLDTYTRTDYISIPKACMRHIVLSEDKKYAYVSDMYNCKIYKIDMKTFSILSSAKVYINPNTIDILKVKGREYLFVSTRGPNNKEDYTKRSPSNGRIHIINTENMSIVKTFEGGNQPTGLNISPNGKILCFSNFQDENIELYSIE